jgi:hypothetical protein
MIRTLFAPLLLALSLIVPVTAAPRLKVSPNGRYLVHADGRPFFYLGDTAWELFHRLNREEAETYLKDRAAKRFTVIQAVVLAELEGLTDPNPYGRLPLVNRDPTKPVEEYFQHVDYIVNKAADLGLWIGMLPTWGRYAAEENIFTPATARQYGEYLARRYRDKPVIWILGGDRWPNKAWHTEIWRAMAAGIETGAGGPDEALISFHPRGGGESSAHFHNDKWLDFNMQQNGHCAEVAAWEEIDRDYELRPVKPTMDAEPIYEDHPVCFDPNNRGYSQAADIRRLFYWEIFAGAHGHTYGHHSVWQMYDPTRRMINGPLMPWWEAIHRPGAGQMQHGRALIESRPFLTRIPDASILVPGKVAGDVPGGGLRRMMATRDSEGSFLMVYIPHSRTFSVKLSGLTGDRIRAWWFNPRDGKAMRIGEFARTATREFVTPDPGEALDWVLVVDDAARNFPAPGTR